MNSNQTGAQQSETRKPLLLRIRSWLRYGTSLRSKLVVLVLVITFLVVGALYWFSLGSLRSSITAIYEGRARSIATVISKSIQEKDYILYYSEEFDQDIARLQERYESIVGITVIGMSARGFLVVTSTDPTEIGMLADEDQQTRFELLRNVEVERTELGGTAVLRAYHPIFSGPDLIGVVQMDMSLAEQTAYLSRLTLLFGAASIAGIVILGGLLYFALRSIVTKPVWRIAETVGFVSQRKYDVEVPVPFRRIPGTHLRDEVSQLIDGVNLMTKVIHSHEQELKKLVVLDELTGAYTLDHLEAELDRELNKTRRYKHPTSLLIVDLAELAARNDEERDEALVRTASFLVGNLRNVDVLFRISEHRFASLLPETPPAGAAVAAGRLRTLVPDLTSQIPFTFEPSITHVGWGEEGAPGIAEVIERVLGPLDDLKE